MFCFMSGPLLDISSLKAFTMPSASLCSHCLAQHRSQSRGKVFLGNRKKKGIIKAESVKQQQSPIIIRTNWEEWTNARSKVSKAPFRMPLRGEVKSIYFSGLIQIVARKKEQENLQDKCKFFIIGRALLYYMCFPNYLKKKKTCRMLRCFYTFKFPQVFLLT